MRKKIFNGIRFRIAIIFSLLICITIITIIVISYIFSRDVLTDNSDLYTGQLLQQVTNGVDNYVEYMQDISEIIVSNRDVTEYLGAKDIYSSYSRYMKYKLSELFYSITFSRDDITNIAIFGAKDSRYIFNLNQKKMNANMPLEETYWYTSAIEAGGQPVIFPSNVQNIIEDNYSYVVTLARAIKKPVNNDVMGVALVDLNYKKIKDLCSGISLGEKGYVFIIDDKGDIVYHPQQQLIYSGLKSEDVDLILKSGEGTLALEDNSGRAYMVKKSPATNWRVVGVTYAEELGIISSRIQFTYLVAAFIFVAIALGMSYYFSYRVTKPIRGLQESMKEAEKGNFDKKVYIKTNDEIEALSNSYNIMIDKIEGLMKQIINEQKLKRKNELKILQAQINPHFLYNTLDSIIWMAELGESKNVVLMTSSLAKLLRISINRGSEIITVRRELEYIKSYLTILKMRYGDKIEYSIDVDENIMNKQILKLLLQPLVENSVYHGLKNRENGGVIRITGHEEGGRLKIIIYDTGVGMTAEELDNIFKKDIERDNGVGINNVDERIKLFFGNDYGISFKSEFHKYTEAVIIIPSVDCGV
ncbi:MAG: sensor histidine kinase [Clostridiales bacterium]|jgi:two-component system sensor histidine kinase YesM|nr:sensor histidine kinase [Clostridiales bacterium]